MPFPHPHGPPPPGPPPPGAPAQIGSPANLGPGMPGNHPTQHMSPEYLREQNDVGLLAVSGIFLICDTLFFLLRLLARRRRSVASFGWDDIMLIPAFIINIGICVMGIVAAKVGHVGRHTLALIYLSHGPQGLKPILMSLWAVNPIWYFAVALPKLSVLILYLRIFPSRIMRMCSIAVFFIVCANAIACLIATAVVCRPLAAFWDPNVHGKCISYQALFVLSNIPHVVTDVLIMVLPIPTLVRLQMKLAKKAGIIAIFLAGSVGIIASCNRLVFFLNARTNLGIDVAWGAGTGLAWSITEAGMCFSAACWLAFKPLFEDLSHSKLGSFLSSSLSRNKHTGDSSGPSEESKRATFSPPISATHGRPAAYTREWHRINDHKDLEMESGISTRRESGEAWPM